MPDRYWVGGTASWDGTAGTKWADTSGGAGGQSVPTSADDVFFDAASGAVTCTIATGNTGAKSITCTGFTGTLAGSAAITVSGSITLVAGMTYSRTGSTTFAATGTIISAGKTFRTITVNAAGQTVTLGDALLINVSNGLVVTAGTFSTNNYSLTAGVLSSSNSNTRAINLGSSTVTLNQTSDFATLLNFSTSTNLTFSAGTSQITVAPGANSTFAGGGQTFYNVTYNAFSPTFLTVILTGVNTFNSLSFTGRNEQGLGTVNLAANQTISTLTLTAAYSSSARIFVASDTLGTTRTLTCGAFSGSNVDFRDIAVTGAAAPISGTSFGDCKGNSGITFPAPKTVYYRQTANSDWGTSDPGSWSATSGGAFDATMFPLAQDTAVFPSATYPASGASVRVNHRYNIGTVDMSARTTNTISLVINVSGSGAVYGNWINGTGTTMVSAGTLTFSGRGSQTITSAGQSFAQDFVIDTPGGSVALQDALTISSNNGLDVNSGTFNANNYNVTISSSFASFASSTSSVRTVAVGSGTWTLAGYGWSVNATNLTVTGTGTISLTSTSDKTFTGGGIQTYPTINQGGTGTLTISESNKFADITNTAVGRVQFTGGTTNTFTAFNLNGSSGNLLPLGSTNTTQVVLRKASTWLMGANSTDGGNNSGLLFTSGGGIDYLSVSRVRGSVIYQNSFFAMF